MNTGTKRIGLGEIKAGDHIKVCFSEDEYLVLFADFIGRVKKPEHFLVSVMNLTNNENYKEDILLGIGESVELITNPTPAFFFTYGTDGKFPYQGGYTMVRAADKQAATELFRKKHPDRTPDTVNCAFIYDEAEWIETYKFDLKDDRDRYKYCHEVLLEEPDDLSAYAVVVIFVPAKNEVVYISEGTGGNLLREDIAAGYVDYINVEAVSCDCGLSESDGGEFLLTQLFRDEYSSTKECIPDVLDFLYDDESLKYVILESEEETGDNE